MTIKTVTANGCDIRIAQFDTIEEAMQEMPEPLLLNFINACWRNTQVTTYIDGVREAYRAADKKRR